MKYTKYCFQFLVICIFFIIFKILGSKLSSKLSGKIFEKIGPYFRSAEIIRTNILRVFPNINFTEINIIKNDMWNNYGIMDYLAERNSWSECSAEDLESYYIEIERTQSKFCMPSCAIEEQSR